MIKPKKILENISPYEVDFYRKDWHFKLDANENVYGCANNILNVIKNISEKEISLYPAYGKLIDSFSDKYFLNNDEILFTNGCDEALNVIINTYLEEHEELLSYQPTFSMPALYAKIAGAKVKYIDYDKKYLFNKDKIRKEIGLNTKIVYLSTPNNPTGEVIEASLIKELADEFKNILFVIDCTYVNFSFSVSFEDYIGLINDYQNIIIVKSFSKDFGIAGLRLGVVVGDVSIIKNLKKVISPYSVNSIALNCALMILNEENQIEELKNKNKIAKDLLMNILIENGFKPYESEANFILCDFGTCCDFYYEKMQSNGIITRKYSSESSLKNCLRITIPTLDGVRCIEKILKLNTKI